MCACARGRGLVPLSTGTGERKNHQNLTGRGGGGQRRGPERSRRTEEGQTSPARPQGGAKKAGWGARGEQEFFIKNESPQPGPRRPRSQAAGSFQLAGAARPAPAPAARGRPHASSKPVATREQSGVLCFHSRWMPVSPGVSGMQPRDPCCPWRGTLASGYKPS